MAFRETSFPTPTQEDVRVFNISLPMEPVSSSQRCNFSDEEYEPELMDLIRAVECPVCRCIPNLPIYNCVNGHFSCSSCRPRLPFQRCAYCLAKFTKMRNYPLENLVTARVFICDFRTAGCKIRDMSMLEYEEHMKKCWFRSLACPPKKKQETCQHQTSSSSSEVKCIEFSCPRCNFMNSKRKLKCQNCQINLRVPTPICNRPSWVTDLDQRDNPYSIDSL